MKLKIKNEYIDGRTETTVKETVILDGEEIFSGEYWPDSQQSGDAHDRALFAALRRHDAVELYEEAQWSQ